MVADVLIVRNRELLGKAVAKACGGGDTDGGIRHVMGDILQRMQNRYVGDTGRLSEAGHPSGAITRIPPRHRMVAVP
jgi:hypothetical protein